MEDNDGHQDGGGTIVNNSNSGSIVANSSTNDNNNSTMLFELLTRQRELATEMRSRMTTMEELAIVNNIKNGSNVANSNSGSNVANSSSSNGDSIVAINNDNDNNSGTQLAELFATVRSIDLRTSGMDSWMTTMEGTIQVLISVVSAAAGGAPAVGEVGDSSTQLRMISRLMTSNNNAGKDPKIVAEEVYGLKSNNYRSNLQHVNRVMDKYPQFFSPIVAKCPNFNLMFLRILVNSFGFNAGRID